MKPVAAGRRGVGAATVGCCKGFTGCRPSLGVGFGETVGLGKRVELGVSEGMGCLSGTTVFAGRPGKARGGVATPVHAASPASRRTAIMYDGSIIWQAKQSAVSYQQIWPTADG